MSPKHCPEATLPNSVPVEIVSQDASRIAMFGRAVINAHKRIPVLALETVALATAGAVLAANAVSTGPEVPEAQGLRAPAVSASPFSTSPESATPSTPDASPKTAEQAPKIEISEMKPVRAVFTMQQGTLTVNVNPSEVKLIPKDGYYEESIDPPLVYCPGIKPDNVLAKYTTATTESGCETLYYVTNYGLPSYGAKSKKPKPTVIAGHTSGLGYKLSGNFMAGVKLNDTVTIYDGKNDLITYKAVKQYVPRKGTNDVGDVIAGTDDSHLITITCNQDGMTNSATDWAPVSAKLAPPPVPSPPHHYPTDN